MYLSNDVSESFEEFGVSASDSDSCTTRDSLPSSSEFAIPCDPSGDGKAAPSQTFLECSMSLSEIQRRHVKNNHQFVIPVHRP